MVHAYLIEDVRALADLFKVNQAPKRSADGKFTAYQVRHPEAPRRQALVLLGMSSQALRPEALPASVGREIHATVEEGQLYWYVDGERQPLEVLHAHSSPHLSELIGPVPWRHEALLDVPVLFWLRDPALMSRIVWRSLYLNNDRVQVVALEGGDGESITLVRIESPSHYLIAWCEEQDPEAVELFYPMTEGPGLYVQWRHEHPLAELWRRAWLEQTERWAFFPARGARRTIPRPEWRSVYDFTEFTSEIGAPLRWEPAGDDLEPFEIALELTPRHEPASVEMLLLEGEERTRLEDFLALADEETVDALELAARRDERGQVFFFVRERHRGDGTVLVDLGGRTFARYKGFDNLFLPTELVLEPQLRRDQYKELFALDPLTLTFVIPEEPGQRGGQAHQLRVPRAAFEPLRHFVDHVVHFEREALEQILEDSVFELGVYAEALSRPDLRREDDTRRARKNGEQGERPERPEREGRDRARIERARARRERSKRQGRQGRTASSSSEGEDDEAIEPTELELLEAEIERELIRQGPLSELWADLRQVKRQRQAWEDMVRCSTEGLWTTHFPLGQLPPGQLDEQARGAFVGGLIESAKRVGASGDEAMRTVAELFELMESAEGDDAARIMQAQGRLRQVDAQLGKKLRWLAWRGLLARTQDVRAQEEVRESLLEELNAQGLQTRDVASFLRERILKDPELELDDEALQDGESNSFVFQNIEVVEGAVNQMRLAEIRHAAQASLARILAGMAMHARARELITRALEGMEASLSPAMMGQQADEAPAYTSSPSVLDRLRDVLFGREDDGGDPRDAEAGSIERPERWQVWVAHNAWLVFQRVEPARAEQARQTYEALFERLGEHERSDLLRKIESLESRVGQSNVAEHLALESRAFFSSRPLPDAMNRVVTGLQGAHKRQGEGQVHALVERGIDLALRELHDTSHSSLETVARLILEMVEGLRRLKWERESRPVEQFEQFVRDLPLDPPSPDASRLYFAVLHCAASRALMDLGREQEAISRIVDILRWVGEDYMQVLDFVDLVVKEILLTVELAPRNQRAEALRQLMETTLEQERFEIGDEPVAPGAHPHKAYQFFELVQMIDHTLEAAISNEKLVLRRLRDFEEREEARIRYWVQRDQPAE